MMPVEHRRQLADRFYDCRRAARTILGDAYAETLQPSWRASLLHWRKVNGVTTLQAAIEMTQRLGPDDEDGVALMLIFAAAIDLIAENA